jgi:circadian clock protein KaiB
MNAPSPERLVRRVILFIAGKEANSALAVANLDKLCVVADGCEIHAEVVDVLEQYKRALDHGVLVTPCLILVDPPPRAIVVGTLKDLHKVRTALRLPVIAGSPDA